MEGRRGNEVLKAAEAGKVCLGQAVLVFCLCARQTSSSSSGGAGPLKNPRVFLPDARPPCRGGGAQYPRGSALSLRAGARGSQETRSRCRVAEA